jgi:hypothetical protein
MMDSEAFLHSQHFSMARISGAEARISGGRSRHRLRENSTSYDRPLKGQLVSRDLRYR